MAAGRISASAITGREPRQIHSQLRNYRPAFESIMKSDSFDNAPEKLAGALEDLMKSASTRGVEKEVKDILRTYASEVKNDIILLTLNRLKNLVESTPPEILPRRLEQTKELMREFHDIADTIPALLPKIERMTSNAYLTTATFSKIIRVGKIKSTSGCPEEIGQTMEKEYENGRFDDIQGIGIRAVHETNIVSYTQRQVEVASNDNGTLEQLVVQQMVSPAQLVSDERKHFEEDQPSLLVSTADRIQMRDESDNVKEMRMERASDQPNLLLPRTKKPEPLPDSANQVIRAAKPPKAKGKGTENPAALPARILPPLGIQKAAQKKEESDDPKPPPKTGPAFRAAKIKKSPKAKRLIHRHASIKQETARPPQVLKYNQSHHPKTNKTHESKKPNKKKKRPKKNAEAKVIEIAKKVKEKIAKKIKNPRKNEVNKPVREATKPNPRNIESKGKKKKGVKKPKEPDLRNEKKKERKLERKTLRAKKAVKQMDCNFVVKRPSIRKPKSIVVIRVQRPLALNPKDARKIILGVRNSF